MFNMALLNSGFNIDSPSLFTQPLQKLINVGFGLKREEPIEEIEVDVEEEDEKKEDEAEEQINPDDLEVEELNPNKDDSNEDNAAGQHDEL